MEGYTNLAYNPDAGDEKLYVVFKLMPVLQQDASTDAGRPIYEDRECIEIRVPGDRDVIVREVQERDKFRFPRQWAAFKAGKGEAIVGTPLDAVPWLTRSQVEELGYFKIRTVEQLAELSDAHAQKFAGIQTLKARAKDFLAAAAGAAPAEKLRAELEQRDNEIALLKRQQAEMAEALAEIRKGSADKKKG